MISPGRPPAWLRAGYLADGAFKVAVAAGYAAFAPQLTAALSAPVGLLGATAALVGTSGIAEIVFAIRRGTRSHVGVLAGYDSGWVLVTGIAWLLADSGGGSAWLGYQALGSAALTVIFAAGSRGVGKKPGPDPPAR